MAQSSVFPAFIVDEYRPGTGFAQFEQSARAAAEGARRSFEASGAQIQETLQRALTMPRTAGGSLDLGVGQMREAAAADQARAIAAREYAQAAERAARAIGDNSAATRLHIQAARANAIEMENGARASGQQAAAMERVQSELSQTASRTTQVIAANRGLIASQGAYTNSARASRFAMVQVGQQLQDVAIQAQMGTSALTILVQQGSQLGFAMSQMTGRAAAFGRFIAGPWGTMIFLGVAALGYLTGAMSRTSEASREGQQATDLFAQAQSALGNVFDLTTGKLLDQTNALREHTEVLRLNAEVMALTLRAQAALQEESSRRLFREGTEPISIGERISAMGSRRPGAFSAQDRAAAEQRTLLQNIQTAQRALDVATGEAERRAAETALRESRRAAMRASEAPQFGRNAGISAEDFRQAILDDAASRSNRRVSEMMQESLDSNRLDPSFRRDRRGGRQREDQRPRQADQALEQIQRINEQWDAQPRLVDRAVQATRELDHILAEAQRRKLPRFEEMARGAREAQAAIRDGLIREITENFQEAPRLVQRAAEAMEQLSAAAQQFPDLAPRIAAAGDQVVNALVRPYREFLEDQVRAYETGQLIAQGRDEEAQALGIIHQLEQQLGPLGEDRKQVILDSVVALREQSRALEIIRDRQQSYLRAADDVRGSITDLLANPQRGLAGLADLGSSLSQAFNRLNAEVIVDRMFGGVFRQIEDHVTGRDRVRQANEEYAQSIGSVRAELTNLRSSHHNEVSSIDDVIAAMGRFTGALDTASAAVSRPAGAPVGVGTASSSVLPGLPVGGRITDSFADHRARGSAGLDIAGPLNSAITARAGGRVVTVGFDSRSGYNVIVDHGGGIVSSYSHLIRQSPLREGQAIAAGDLLGNRGSTGKSTGSHLHYRIRQDGRDVDPQSFQFPEHVAQAQAAIGELGTGLDDLRAVVASLSDGLPAAAGMMHELEKAIGDAADAAQEEIVVTGSRSANADPTARLNPRDFMRQLLGNMVAEVFGKRVGDIVGRTVATAMEGASYGQFGASTLLGSGANRTGSSIGGALGQVAGEALGDTFGKMLGSLGQFAGPVGAIIGGITGSLFGGLFKPPPPSGQATITNAYATPVVSGSNAAIRTQASDLGAAVQENVRRIAELLGGTIQEGVGRVSIGTYDGTVRVNPSGGETHGRNKGFTSYGEDTDAAVRAAVLDLIKDGIIAGLRAGTQRLLQSGKDLDAAIQKALDFEGVFTSLKERVDPVGAALDALDKRFDRLKRVFEEAGASTEDYADLEKLYSFEREDAIKEAGERMTSALKGLLDDLTINNDAFSLRDRLAQARAKYDPLAARIAAGDKTVDYDAFAEAARLVEQLTRQIDGSTSPYFQVLEEITRLTQSALSSQENLISIATARDPAVTPPDTDPTVTAIDWLGGHIGDILNGNFSAVNDNLGVLIRQGNRFVSASGGGAADSIQNF